MQTGELRVWKEAYGAPSLDHVSILALTYAKINRMSQLKTVNGCLPYWAAVPCYRNSKGVFKKPQDILFAMRSALVSINE